MSSRSSSSRESQGGSPEVTSAEVAELFDLVRLGSTITTSALIEHLDGKIEAIAEREGLTKGGVISRIKDADDVTLLHVAAGYGRKEVLDYYFSDTLFEHETNLRRALLRAKTASNDSPIHMAARSGEAQFIKALVDRGVQVDSRGSFGCAALHFAARRKGDLATVWDLFRLGASLDFQNLSGQTPLHLAVAENDAVIVEVLICMGADAAIRNAAGLTPGVLARNHPDGEVYRLFVERDLPC